MVRLKHRYILINILYPPSSKDSPLPASSSSSTVGTGTTGKLRTSSSNDDWQTQFHLQVCRPTTDKMTPALLARMVRDAVDELYGDWGMGRLGGAGAGSLSGEYLVDLSCVKWMVLDLLDTPFVLLFRCQGFLIWMVFDFVQVLLQRIVIPVPTCPDLFISLLRAYYTPSTFRKRKGNLHVICSNVKSSKILLPRNINSHNPLSPLELPSRLVRTNVHITPSSSQGRQALLCKGR